MMDAAGAIAAVKLTAEQKTMMLDGLKKQRDSVLAIRSMKIPNSVAPAFVFDPVPAGMKLDTARKPMRMSKAPDVKTLVSGGEEALAFASVRELAELVKTRKVTSVELTKMYLARLKKYDPRLHFVITLTEDRALAQAAAADKEIAAGRYRGPLHGIPWGEGSAGGEGVSDDVGGRGIREAELRLQRDGRRAAGCRGSGAGGEAEHGRVGAGRSMVWSENAKSLEYEAGVKRVFCGERERSKRRLRWVRHWYGDAGVYLVAEHPVRDDGIAAYIRICAADGCDGAELDDGQDRADMPKCRRLRPGDERYLRARRA
jgi:hypothetical protein